jgi:predicted ester cyclase
MSARSEESKALVRSFFGAVERGDFAVFDQIVARDYNDHLAGQSPGLENVKLYFRGLRSAFPDLKLPIAAIVAEEDLVAVMNSIRGTHKGEFAGVKQPASQSMRWHFSSTESQIINSPSTGKLPTSARSCGSFKSDVRTLVAR